MQAIEERHQIKILARKILRAGHLSKVTRSATPAFAAAARVRPTADDNP